MTPESLFTKKGVRAFFIFIIRQRYRLKSKEECILVIEKCTLVAKGCCHRKECGTIGEKGEKMKVKVEQDQSCTEIEVVVRYAEKNKRIDRIVSLLQSVDMQIRCDIDNAEKMINVADVYYIESVEKRTFVYLEKSVYHTDFRLYQLIHKLKEYGFVQISKSCILNINFLDSIKPLLNSRMEVTLKNGEKVYINRKYLRAVKSVLEEMEQNFFTSKDVISRVL